MSRAGLIGAGVGLWAVLRLLAWLEQLWEDIVARLCDALRV